MSGTWQIRDDVALGSDSRVVGFAFERCAGRQVNIRLFLGIG